MFKHKHFFRVVSASRRGVLFACRGGHNRAYYKYVSKSSLYGKMLKES